MRSTREVVVNARWDDGVLTIRDFYRESLVFRIDGTSLVLLSAD